MLLAACGTRSTTQGCASSLRCTVDGAVQVPGWIRCCAAMLAAARKCIPRFRAASRRQRLWQPCACLGGGGGGRGRYAVWSPHRVPFAVGGEVSRHPRSRSRVCEWFHKETPQKPGSRKTPFPRNYSADGLSVVPQALWSSCALLWFM